MTVNPLPAIPDRMAAGGQALRIERARRRRSVPLVDRDHLDSLARHIGRAATCDLLGEGRAELVDRLDRLARPAGDEIGTLAHQVCGLAGNLGLPLVAHEASRTAEACRAGRDIGRALTALLQAIEPSLAALDAWRTAAQRDV